MNYIDIMRKRALVGKNSLKSHKKIYVTFLIQYTITC